MSGEPNRALRLEHTYLALALLPLAVVMLADAMLNSFAFPTGSEATIEKHPSLHADATGRVYMATGFMLLVASTATAAVFFVRKMGRLDRPSLAATIVVIVVSLIVTWAFFAVSNSVQTQELLGQRLFCAAGSTPGGSINAGTEAAHESRAYLTGDSVPANCLSERFKRFRILLEIEKRMLGIAVVAVVFGAIACLARLRGANPDAKALARFHRRQIADLNTILYISAFLLVSGLIFVSAFLHWPHYVIAGDAAARFKAHADALVLFYGVSYSVLIASFYLPVLLLLTARLRASGADISDAGAQGLSFPELMKVGAAIFAPMLTSMLGSVVNVPGVFG
ncbi:MAG: hypothetical protein ACFBQW_04150 [Sphingomonadaceae bacterium]